MTTRQTITINGRHYDAHSGLAVDTPGIPVETSQPTAKNSTHVPTHSAGIHSGAQRSQTLNRKTTKRPHPTATPSSQKVTHEIITRKQAPLRTESRQHKIAVSKFAPHPVAHKKRVMDIGPTAHPHVVKAHAISQAKADAPLHAHAPEPRKTSRQIKQSAIHTAIENTSVNHSIHAKKPLLKRHPRALSIVSASFALVLLAGYLTYLNMPSLSVRVAAAQAGINATYPNYQPDGYSLNGTVGYSQGKVSMRFASNSGPTGFTVNQTKSNWDSAAVLDNYVAPRTGASYVPYTERGLTIYTFGNNAAWVNGGILYTIDGNAPLSSEQIRRIATSLI